MEGSLLRPAAAPPARVPLRQGSLALSLLAQTTKTELVCPRQPSRGGKVLTTHTHARTTARQGREGGELADPVRDHDLQGRGHQRPVLLFRAQVQHSTHLLVPITSQPPPLII